MPDTNKVKDPSKRVEEAKRIAKKNDETNVFSGFEELFFRFFRWLSTLVDRIFFQTKNLALFALILAIALFAFVYISEGNFSTNLASSRTLQNVSVNARYNSESFEVSGLPTNCSVVLSGDAANVNNASTKAGYCLLNLEGYTEGTHTVDLIASGYGDNVQTVTVPSQTQVVLKRKTTAQYDLGYDFINRNALDSKYILSTPTFENGQSKVNIRASQDTLNSIALVKALIDVSGQISDFTIDAPLVAYNNKGQQVNAEIVPSSVKASVKISSPSKTVPIILNVTGEAPTGFSLDTVSLDHQTTAIYAPQDVLENIDEVKVNLDLSTITTDADIMQPIVIPSGVSASEITMVNIQLTLAESTSKEIENVPIVYKNNDNNLGASEVDTTTVTVTVVGSSKNIEEITASDCIAYIDLKDSEGNLLEPGSYDLVVTVEKNTNAFVSFTCEPRDINITLIGQE